jgi:hypothetical protein
MFATVLLLIAIPAFILGCWILLSLERESRQNHVYHLTDNIVPLPSPLATPIVSPRPLKRAARPRLYVLHAPDQSKSKLR